MLYGQLQHTYDKYNGKYLVQTFTIQNIPQVIFHQMQNTCKILCCAV